MDTLTLGLRVSEILGREVAQSELREMLRFMFPDDAPESGWVWDLTARQVCVVEDCCRRVRAYHDGDD